MSSGKWRSFYLGLNVLIYDNSHAFVLYLTYDAWQKLCHCKKHNNNEMIMYKISINNKNILLIIDTGLLCYIIE